jgi:hypothetical protein
MRSCPGVSRQDRVGAGGWVIPRAWRLASRGRSDSWSRRHRSGAARGAYAGAWAWLRPFRNGYLKTLVTVGRAAFRKVSGVRTEGSGRPVRLLVARKSYGRGPGRQSDDAQLIGKGHEDETEKRLWARREPDDKLMQHLYPRCASPFLARKIRGVKLPAACRRTRGVVVN